MQILISLSLIAAIIVDVLRAGASPSMLWYLPPIVLIIAVVLEKETSLRLVYGMLFVSGIVFDVLTNELFGTNGVLMFICLALANLLLRSMERSTRKTLLKLGIVSASYIVIRAVVW